MEAIRKGRVGKFEYWLAGKMRWEVRCEGAVLAVRQNMSDCVRACERFDHQEKHPELYAF